MTRSLTTEWDVNVGKLSDSVESENSCIGVNFSVNLSSGARLSLVGTIIVAVKPPWGTGFPWKCLVSTLSVSLAEVPEASSKGPAVT
jgi:hypothetical protein